ncbi:hypothetical protein [Clavibacter michiganensis]|uniref:hypothetical protein n=1 Tax=Clavibacter michiganensis TaxID=28447 RepID=UPI0029319E3C|nr:hypothetical protein [Clavibacter michiganensis]
MNSFIYLIVGAVIVVALPYVYWTERERWAPFNELRSTRRPPRASVPPRGCTARANRAIAVVRSSFEDLRVVPRVQVEWDHGQLVAMNVIYASRPVPWLADRAHQVEIEHRVAALLGGEWTSRWNVRKDIVRFEINAPTPRVGDAASPASQRREAPPADQTPDDDGQPVQLAIDLDQIHADAARARWARVACGPAADERRRANEACARHVDALLELAERHANAESGAPSRRRVLASEPFSITLCEETLHTLGRPVAAGEDQ